ncbi:MAG: molybdate ABC transporter substrate-binding protein [Spirochaetota bacterium]
MKVIHQSSILVIAVLVLAIPVSAQKQEVVLSAAASLTDVLTALKPEAEKYIGASLVFNFGASGTLRAQIEQGAPVDVFFSAAASHMNTLEKAALLVPGSRKNILSNSMVLISDGTIKGPIKSEALRNILSSASLLAIGNPDSVPAGTYAVEALRSFGLHGIMEKKLVLGGNVRQVLQFVESGSAPLGIVFLTDAASVAKGSPVSRLFIFPDSALASPIVYPAAIIAASKQQALAAKLMAFFHTDSARQAFTESGFAVP